MKNIRVLFIVIISASFVSCASTVSESKKEAELAGYTLKNKKELLLQKVLFECNKTAIATD